MRCDAAGLLSRAGQVIVDLERELRLRYPDYSPEDFQAHYYAEGLRQFAKHIEETAEGKHTLAELLECYCLEGPTVALPNRPLEVRHLETQVGTGYWIGCPYDQSFVITHGPFTHREDADGALEALVNIKPIGEPA